MNDELASLRRHIETLEGRIRELERDATGRHATIAAPANAGEVRLAKINRAAGLPTLGGGLYVANRPTDSRVQIPYNAPSLAANLPNPVLGGYTSDNPWLVVNPFERGTGAKGLADGQEVAVWPTGQTVIGPQSLQFEVCVFVGGGGSPPIGTGKYKVVQILDDLDPGTLGLDYLRFP